MDADTLAIVLRMLERIIIVIGGIVTIYLGYRLFTLGIDKTQGEAIAFGVTLRNFGPGIFFAAIGAAVLMASVQSVIRTGRETTTMPVDVTDTAAASVPQTDAQKVYFLGIEDPTRQTGDWSPSAFFLETRDLLQAMEQGKPQEQIEVIAHSLGMKLESITMTEAEFETYDRLSRKIELTEEEEAELSRVQRKLVPP